MWINADARVALRNGKKEAEAAKAGKAPTANEDERESCQATGSRYKEHGSDVFHIMRARVA